MEDVWDLLFAAFLGVVGAYLLVLWIA